MLNALDRSRNQGIAPNGHGLVPGALKCGAFRKDSTLAKVASGALGPIELNAKGDSVKTAQAALYTLGHLQARAGVDGSFGPKTQAAIRAFQAKAKLEQTGAIDRATLRALDATSARQMAELKAATIPDGKRRNNYELVEDIADPAHTRLYALGGNGKVVAMYLTSPGTAAHPTRGDKYRISAAKPRQPWVPPNSPWARGLKTAPPGIDNPMGILKLQLGDTAQYIHGIPPSEERDLGHAASHGCLRVSGSNVLEIGEKYAEPGTRVRINRSSAESARLATLAASAGVSERPTDAGREYMFAYLSGELGALKYYRG